METANPNIQLILQLLKAKNSSAIGMIYDAYAAMLFGVAVRITRNHVIAETLLQETLVDFFCNHSSYDENRQSLPVHLIDRMRILSMKSVTPANLTHSKSASSSESILEFVFLTDDVSNAAEKYSINENQVRKLIHTSLSPSINNSEQVS